MAQTITRCLRLLVPSISCLRSNLYGLSLNRSQIRRPMRSVVVDEDIILINIIILVHEHILTSIVFQNEDRRRRQNIKALHAHPAPAEPRAD